MQLFHVSSISDLPQAVINSDQITHDYTKLPSFFISSALFTQSKPTVYFLDKIDPSATFVYFHNSTLLPNYKKHEAHICSHPFFQNPILTSTSCCLLQHNHYSIYFSTISSNSYPTINFIPFRQHLQSFIALPEFPSFNYDQDDITYLSKKGLHPYKFEISSPTQFLLSNSYSNYISIPNNTPYKSDPGFKLSGVHLSLDLKTLYANQLTIIDPNLSKNNLPQPYNNLPSGTFTKYSSSLSSQKEFHFPLSSLSPDPSTKINGQIRSSSLEEEPHLVLTCSDIPSLNTKVFHTLPLIAKSRIKPQKPFIPTLICSPSKLKSLSLSDSKLEFIKKHDYLKYHLKPINYITVTPSKGTRKNLTGHLDVAQSLLDKDHAKYTAMESLYSPVHPNWKTIPIEDYKLYASYMNKLEKGLYVCPSTLDSITIPTQLEPAAPIIRSFIRQITQDFTIPYSQPDSKLTSIFIPSTFSFSMLNAERAKALLKMILENKSYITPLSGTKLFKYLSSHDDTKDILLEFLKDKMTFHEIAFLIS